jgi:hypothetical protein
LFKLLKKVVISEACIFQSCEKIFNNGVFVNIKFICRKSFALIG